MADQSNEFNDEIDLGALLGTLWRGKLTILLCAVVALCLGVAYAKFVAVPIYTSTTTLAIKENGPSVIDIESVMSGVSSDSDSLNTEIEVLKSRDLLERLSAELDLVNDPEFNPTIRPKSFIGSLLGGDDQTFTEQEITNKIVENLGRAISASVRRSTFIISISVTTQNAEKSGKIANALAQLYREDQIRVKFETLEDAVTWLSARVVELKAELQTRNDELKIQTAEADYINDEGLQALNLQVRELRERLISEQNDANRAIARLTELKAVAASGDIDAILTLTQDQVLRRLSTQGTAETVLADGSEFNARLDLLIENAAKDVERGNAQVAAITSTIEDMELRVDEQATKLAELQRLQREIDTTSVLYDTFLTRLKETTIQQGIQQPDARVLSTAINGRKVAPRTSMIAALSLILGLMVGAGIVLLREMRANGFRTADELQHSTGLQVIGQIPVFPMTARTDLIKYLKDKPTSPAVEAVRNLRTSLLLSNVDNPPQVIMSTSSLPSEGKTTQAISLVQNFAGMGKKVLLIEGDIRRRTLNEYFKAEAGEHGLLSVISGDVALSDAIIKSESIGADILMGQVSHINAADIFSSDKFTAFLKEMRKLYDYIIIDTPPVLVVPDARVIGQHCDAIMYSVRWDSTTKTQVLSGLRELATVNLQPSGLILSHVDPKGMKKYGYGESYGAYSSYGGGYYDA
ncbi:GumC family protein [Thalassospira alkalitolerans]|uniref:GumC family protein n=1 Tax=Thalassospira alkalitolerans TaxID=1293890 RepID=UPI003AA907B6